MSKKLVRIVVWTIFMAAIGAFFSMKTAMIDTQEVRQGALIGGSIGYFIGILLNFGK